MQSTADKQTSCRHTGENTHLCVFASDDVQRSCESYTKMSVTMDTRAAIDTVMRQRGLYDRARQVLRQYAEKVSGSWHPTWRVRAALTATLQLPIPPLFAPSEAHIDSADESVQCECLNNRNCGAVAANLIVVIRMYFEPCSPPAVRLQPSHMQCLPTSSRHCNKQAW